ncbi:MAG TPA: universal stress protein [Anaerolineales bacterium]|nr:universal stress protein [Anaerolineales bacterium]
MFKRILLAVDGSEHAVHAATVAGELARRMNSQLRIVIVYDPIPHYLGEPNLQFAISARLKEAQEILQRASDAVGSTKDDQDTEIIEGSPAEAIIELAKTHKSDLIVMGSRGLGKLAGLVMGSTSQKVVSHAPCPVLIVR